MCFNPQCNAFKLQKLCFFVIICDKQVLWVVQVSSCCIKKWLQNDLCGLLGNFYINCYIGEIEPTQMCTANNNHALQQTISIY